MKINDEGTSNAAYWHERAMKAEARLAEAERLLRRAANAAKDNVQGDMVVDEIRAFLRPCPRPFKEDDGSATDCVRKGHCGCGERLADSATGVQK